MSPSDYRVLYPNLDLYEGGLFHLRRTRRGRLYSYDSGDLYEGEWAEDRRSGQGKLSVKREAVVIEGLFHEDQIVEGRLTDRWENRFQGRFERGRLQGRVNVRYANGDTFVGEYKDGKKCG